MCKCKKRTELFCFVHKKAVCENCIATDHQVCVVKSYVEWLTDPDFEPPSCGICKGELAEGSTVRLLCLDMFHPECLDVYACSLPPNTAQAGYVCPTCSKPMIPPPNNTGSIAQHIRNTFAKSPWASLILPPVEEQQREKSSSHSGSHSHSGDSSHHASPLEALPSPSPASLLPPQATTQNLNQIPNSKDSSSSSPYTTTTTNSQYYSPSSMTSSMTTSMTTTTTAAQSTANPNQSQSYSIEIQNPQNSSSLYGVAARKATKPGSKYSSYPMDEEDEDKYKRKGIMQLFSALGLVSKATGADAKRGVRLDTRRVVLLFALVGSFATVLILYLLVLDKDESLVTPMENPQFN